MSCGIIQRLKKKEKKVTIAQAAGSLNLILSPRLSTIGLKSAHKTMKNIKDLKLKRHVHEYFIKASSPLWMLR